MQTRIRTILVALGSGGAAVAALTVLGATPSGAVDGTAANAAGEGYRVTIEIDGNPIATFSEVVNLKSEAPVDDEPFTPPRPVIALRTGPDLPIEVYAWHQAILDGDHSAFRDFSMIIYDQTGEIISRYYVEKGWPRLIKASSIDGYAHLVTFSGDSLRRVP